MGQGANSDSRIIISEQLEDERMVCIFHYLFLYFQKRFFFPFLPQRAGDEETLLMGG
jgi:hypothetical protein